MRQMMRQAVVDRACGCRERVHYISPSTREYFQTTECPDCRFGADTIARRRAERLKIPFADALAQVQAEREGRRASRAAAL